MLDGQFNDAGLVRERLDGLIGWWATAGVDCVVGEESVNWLKPPAPRPPRLDIAASTPGVATAARPAQATAPLWPDTIDAFLAYLAQARDLPESRWPGQPFLPRGVTHAPRLMILLPAPESHGTEEGAPMPAPAMHLLSNMLRAVGLSLEECHLATLSLTAPPGGLLDADIIAPLLRRMRHHIGLVAPKALLLVGDQTNRAFAPTSDLDGGNNLPFVNHGGGTVACASILHPRLILEQPSAKAGAWKSLRNLFGGQKE